jgi:hypothetical protein
VIIETEIVVAVVSGGGARSAHHETGDGCRREPSVRYGVSSIYSHRSDSLAPSGWCGDMSPTGSP